MSGDDDSRARAGAWLAAYLTARRRLRALARVHNKRAKVADGGGERENAAVIIALVASARARARVLCEK